MAREVNSVGQPHDSDFLSCFMVGYQGDAGDAFVGVYRTEAAARMKAQHLLDDWNTAKRYVDNLSSGEPEYLTLYVAKVDGATLDWVDSWTIWDDSFRYEEGAGD
jgi:hypothetical protein